MLIDNETFCVFDLDDTLYSEYKYYLSGLDAVALAIQELYDIDIKEYLQLLLLNNEKNIFDKLCTFAKLPEDIKYSLLWLYRLHRPKIELAPEIKYFLQEIEKKAQGIAILTDGRSITQRQKIAALGLKHIQTFISEEFGDNKEMPNRFLEISRRYPAKKYIYIGDNQKKDFIMPNLLGWITVCILQKYKTVHEQNIAVQGYAVPQIYIHSLQELLR